MAQALVQRQLTNIYLGGVLGKKFGEKWRLAVASPAEALRAIDVNTRGALMRYLSTEGRAKYYKVALHKKDQLLDAEELAHRSGTNDIYVWPTIKGRNSGVGKIFAGIALIALTIAAPYIGLPTLVGSGSILGGAIGSIAIGLGTSLILGGISQLLSPHPNQQGGELNSNSFQGTIAAGQQGVPVPVVYGKALVSPIPVSIWFNAVDYNTSANAYIGTLEAVSLPGGGMQYVQVQFTPVVNDSGGN